MDCLKFHGVPFEIDRDVPADNIDICLIKKDSEMPILGRQMTIYLRRLKCKFVHLGKTKEDSKNEPK